MDTNLTGLYDFMTGEADINKHLIPVLNEVGVLHQPCQEEGKD